MNKKELLNDIRKHCGGKCDGCSDCLSEVKASHPHKIKEYDDITQCRLHVDFINSIPIYIF